MAEEENKSEESGDSAETQTPAENATEQNAAAVKKAAPKKKAVRKKAVKKKAAAKKAASPSTTDSDAKKDERVAKLAAMGVMPGQASPDEKPPEPPRRIGWQAAIMIAIVIIGFIFIRQLAKSPAETTQNDMDSATVPAEVLNTGGAAPGSAPAVPPMQGGHTPQHPWMMPPAPQQAPMPGRGQMPMQQPYYPPMPPQGYYGYPQQPRYPAPQQEEEQNGSATPAYPQQPPGYYGYPYPQQYPAYPPQYQQ